MAGKRTKIIATLGGAFLLVSIIVCAAFFFIVTQKKNSYQARSIERQETKARLESLDALTKTLEETKSEREFIRSRILTEEEVIDFLALIESLGRNQGGDLTTSSLTVSPLNTDFETLDIDIRVRGTYGAIMNILRQFENLPYQVAISAVNITKEDNDVWVSTFKIKVTKFKKT